MDRCYGRKREIQSLRGRLRARHGSSLIIYGPPGVGKTTLLREFYEGLLREDGVVASYTTTHPGIDPFSHLFAYQLIGLFNSLNKRGEKNDLRDIAASIGHHLGEAVKTEVMKNLFLQIKGHLIRSGFQEVARLADLPWDEEDLFELGLDLPFSLKMDEIVSLMEAFEEALSGWRLVLIIDDFGAIQDQRPDIFRGMLMHLPERTHLYFALDRDVFNGLGLEKEVESFELGQMRRDEVGRWLEREAPNLIEGYDIEDIYRISQGDPYSISEWIRQGPKGEPEEILKDRALGLTDQILEKYDSHKRRHLAKIAMTRYPFSILEYARLFRLDESLLRHYLVEFENDSLISRAYLEGEGVFYLDHPLKQERMISILTKEFNPDELSRELASYFEEQICYPAEEDIAYFWRSLHNTIYYYGLTKDGKDREAHDFYTQLVTLLRREDPTVFSQSLERISSHPYFKELKTRLKIILYALLARSRMDDPALFKKILNELDRFVLRGKAGDEFLVEYAKALFYLANHSGKQEASREITDVPIKIFSILIHKNPKITEIKIIFAHALYNLAHDFVRIQGFDRARDTVGALVSLVGKNPDIPQIKTEYAKALADLSSRLGEARSFDEVFGYLERLRLLAESERDQTDIQIEYAKTLTNTSLYLGREGRFDRLDRVLENLRDLVRTSSGLSDIKVEYAKALANAAAGLSERERFDESSGLIEALATLTVEEGPTQGIKDIYTSTLFNLSSDLGKARRFKTLTDILAKMRQLALEEPSHGEVALAYAKTLYNASYDLGKNGKFDELISNLSLLEELFRKNPKGEIELVYTQTIFNAIMDLGKDRRSGQILGIISSLEELSAGGFKNPETSVVCANALFNLLSYLGEGCQFEEMKEALNLLAGLGIRNERTRKIYLDALVNTSIFFGKGRDFEGLMRIIEEIERYLEADGGRDVRSAYDRVLVNASSQLGREGRYDELKEIMERGRRLSGEMPDDLQMKSSYLDILVNAAVSLGKDDLSDLWEIVERLRGMNETSPGDGLVSIAYTKVLVILGDELEKRGEMIELNKVMSTLEDLSKGDPKVVAFLQTIDFPLF